VYDKGISAVEDGTMRYWGHKLVKVSGERKYYSWEWGDDLQDSITLEAKWKDRSQLKVLAVFMLDHDSLVLMGKDDYKVRKESVHAWTSPKPRWVNSLPRDSGYVYGLGTNRLKRGLHHRSWSLADENAIVSCAKTVKLKYRNLLRDTQVRKNSRLEHVASEKVEVTLKDVQIMGRWLDYKAKTCFSLARARM